jgi:hypothetical protein
VKKLVYAGTELITGDDIALGVLRYCEALADARTAEVIEIPVLTPGGSRSKATFVLGPASQIVAVDVQGAGEEIVDPDLMEILSQRTRAQRPQVTTVDPQEMGAQTGGYAI